MLEAIKTMEVKERAIPERPEVDKSHRSVVVMDHSTSLFTRKAGLSGPAFLFACMAKNTAGYPQFLIELEIKHNDTSYCF
jgi:hypothetical protein